VTNGSIEQIPGVSAAEITGGNHPAIVTRTFDVAGRPRTVREFLSPLGGLGDVGLRSRAAAYANVVEPVEKGKVKKFTRKRDRHISI